MPLRPRKPTVPPAMAVPDGFDLDPAVATARDALVAFTRPGGRAAEAALVHWRDYDRLTTDQRRAVIARVPEWVPVPGASISPARFLVQTVRNLRADGLRVDDVALEPEAVSAAGALLSVLRVPMSR